MELFECLSPLAMIEMNDLVNQAGGLEEILEWALLKMQDELAQLHQALSSATANQQRTQQQYSQAQTEAEKWEGRVKLALEKGRSDLALEALPRQNNNEEMARRLRIQLDKQIAQIETLKRNLKALERKVSQVKQKRDKLKAGSAAAGTHEQVLSPQIPSPRVTAQVDPLLETRLRKLESDLEAEKTQLLIQQAATAKSLKLNSAALEEVRDIIKEVRSQSETKLPTQETLSQSTGELVCYPLEGSYSVLESSSEVDDELEAMKAHLTGACKSQGTGSADSTVISSSASSSALGSEIEDLKRQLDEL